MIANNTLIVWTLKIVIGVQLTNRVFYIWFIICDLQKERLFLKIIPNTVVDTFEKQYFKIIQNTVLEILPKCGYG